MSLLESYKKAATRVAQYLGENHRLKIPRTSALEVVAQVHGARNWQTLAAGERSFSVAPDDDPMPPFGYPVQWGASGNSTLLSKQDWFRHTTVIGTREKREEWFMTQLQEHLASNRPGLFIGLKDLPYSADLPEDHSFSVLSPDTVTDLTPEMVSRIAAGGCWYVNESDTRMAGLTRLVEAVSFARRTRTRNEAMPGYTVAVVDESPEFQIPANVLRQARAFNMALLVGSDQPLRGLAGDNIWNKLYLSQPEMVLKFAEERLAQSESALCNPDSIRFA